MLATVLKGKLAEQQAYHCGASGKDAGKKRDFMKNIVYN